MPSYAIPVKTALFYFIIFSFIATIPWAIYQYRKHGFFSFWRSLIFFSFIYYCLTAFFLVSLPLPASRNDVEFKNHVYIQLKPFNMINNFKEVSGFQFNHLRTYPTLFKSFTFLEVLFNIALLFPLGVYLRYFFKSAKKWYLALIISFFVTLFFEVSQLTGLFGYYKYPYRLFDVDDLMMNTLGGMIGFFVAPLFLFLIPSRDDLQEKDILYQHNKPASYGSQLFEPVISLVIAFFFGSLSSYLFFKDTHLALCNLISAFLFFVVFPLLMKGNTFSGMLLKIKISLNQKNRFLSLLYRFILIYGALILSKIGKMVNEREVDTSYLSILQVILSFTILIIWLFFWGVIVFDWIKKRQTPFFNRLSRINFIRK